jgi:hypothetical protein
MASGIVGERGELVIGPTSVRGETLRLNERAFKTENIFI